jgi:hypothetical protein
LLRRQSFATHRGLVAKQKDPLRKAQVVSGPNYSITLLARTNNAGGTPITLAVFEVTVAIHVS